MIVIYKNKIKEKHFAILHKQRKDARENALPRENQCSAAGQTTATIKPRTMQSLLYRQNLRSVLYQFSPFYYQRYYICHRDSEKSPSIIISVLPLPFVRSIRFTKPRQHYLHLLMTFLTPFVFFGVPQHFC